MCPACLPFYAILIGVAFLVPPWRKRIIAYAKRKFKKEMPIDFEPCPHAELDMGRICTQYPKSACPICRGDK